MNISLEYKLKLHGQPSPATFTPVNDSDLGDGFQGLDFECTHTAYQDLEVSGTLTFEVSGTFGGLVYTHLILSDTSHLNSIECQIRVVDIDCNCDDYLNLYGIVTAKTVGDYCIGTDNKPLNCLKVGIKFERNSTNLLRTTLIDTDKKTNQFAVEDDFALPTILPAHANIKYISADGFAGYNNLLWSIALLGLILSATIAAFLAGILTIPLAAVVAGVVFGVGLAVILAVDWIGERGSQDAIVSPFLRTYVQNVVGTVANQVSGFNLGIDTVMTTPSQSLPTQNAVLTHTIGAVKTGNLEFTYVNWTFEEFAKQINEAFCAKWRVIGSSLHIRHRFEDYIGIIADFTQFEYCTKPFEETLPASAIYEHGVDMNDAIGEKRHLAYKGIVSFTNNEISDVQKGTVERMSEFIESAYRFDGLDADRLEAIDNRFTNAGMVAMFGLFAPFLPVFQVNNNDNDYLLLSQRLTQNPKLIFADPAQSYEKAVNVPNFIATYPDVYNRFIEKGYDIGNLTQPNRRWYNMYAYFDDVLNGAIPNLFSLQRDDPRGTVADATRTYTLPLSCGLLSLLGLLKNGSTPDIAIDFWVNVLNIDGSISVAEIRSIKVVFSGDLSKKASEAVVVVKKIATS